MAKGIKSIIIYVFALIFLSSLVDLLKASDMQRHNYYPILLIILLFSIILMFLIVSIILYNFVLRLQTIVTQNGFEIRRRFLKPLYITSDELKSDTIGFGSLLFNYKHFLFINASLFNGNYDLYTQVMNIY